MNEKYFKAIDSLIPREKSVEKTIEAITKAERSGKVIEMKATKRYRKFTSIGIAAASLALVIALGAIFYPNAVKTAETKPSSSTVVKQNGFFITANAAEATSDEAAPQKITSHKFVKIGKFTPSVGFVTYDVGDNGDNSNNRIAGLFNYNLRCEGDNIDKITYKIDNSTFCIKNGYKPVIDKDGQNDLFKMYGLTVGEKDEYGAYYSYTVDYNNQPDLSKYEDSSNIAPLQILGAVSEDNERGTTVKTHGNAKWSKYYDSIFKDTVIMVTATFKDGSKQSQKLRLNCKTTDGVDNEVYVEAKVIK